MEAMETNTYFESYEDLEVSVVDTYAPIIHYLYMYCIFNNTCLLHT